jgi:hypothetical protein
MLDQANKEKARKAVESNKASVYLLSSVEHKMLSHSFVFLDTL